MARYVSYDRAYRLGVLGRALAARYGVQFGYTSNRIGACGLKNVHFHPAGERPANGKWQEYLTPQDGLGGRWLDVQANMEQAARECVGAAD